MNFNDLRKKQTKIGKLKRMETKWPSTSYIVICYFIENENTFFVLNFIYFLICCLLRKSTLITKFHWKGSSLFGNRNIFQVKFEKVFVHWILSIILKMFFLNVRKVNEKQHFNARKTKINTKRKTIAFYWWQNHSKIQII